MNNQFLHNPHNFLGKLAQLTPIKQYMLLLFITCFPIYLLLIECGKTYQENIEMKQHIQQKEQEINHQKHILASLQQTSQNTFTPELASQIAQINQELQQYSSNLSIKHNQWTFYSFPNLNIKMMGNFTELSKFLTTTLSHQPQLSILQIQISKLQETEKPTPVLLAEFNFKLSIKD